MLASQTDKHWDRGYISGSFDMFHIGHLNLIRRAKERCNYLVVGVLTDELVAGSKKRWPVIPLNERAAIIQALKYVDETDITTPALMDKLAAWEKYRFDAMFSGDDHMHDGWAREEDALRELGAELVFFPYTKDVSTTYLQEMTLPPKAENADKARKIDGLAQGFRHIFPFDKVNKGERIVIYGTGNVGGQYARQLAAVPFCEVVAFVDTYAEPGAVFEGKPCLSPEMLLQGDVQGTAREDVKEEAAYAYDRIVIASTAFHAQILGRLRALGVQPERIV